MDSPLRRSTPDAKHQTLEALHHVLALSLLLWLSCPLSRDGSETRRNALLKADFPVRGLEKQEVGCGCAVGWGEEVRPYLSPGRVGCGGRSWDEGGGRCAKRRRGLPIRRSATARGVELLSR